MGAVLTLSELDIKLEPSDISDTSTKHPLVPFVDLGRWESQRRKKIQVDNSRIADEFIAETSEENSSFEKNRKSLLQLLALFHKTGLCLDTDLCLKSNSASTEAAQALITQLPSDRALPKVAPGDEGEVEMVWEEGDRATILVVDGWRLHIVLNPATNYSQHLPEKPFDGETIPEELLRSIPGQ